MKQRLFRPNWSLTSCPLTYLRFTIMFIVKVVSSALACLAVCFVVDCWCSFFFFSYSDSTTFSQWLDWKYFSYSSGKVHEVWYPFSKLLLLLTLESKCFEISWNCVDSLFDAEDKASFSPLKKIQGWKKYTLRITQLKV